MTNQIQVQTTTMPLEEYLAYCCSGRLPAAVNEAVNKSQGLADLVGMAELIGALEPLGATRPGVCDPVVVVDRVISVPPATINQAGQIVPNDGKAISICAPMNRALVVETLRLLPWNLTAVQSGEAQFKLVNLGPFGGWCLPFEPEQGPGIFVNVEHIVVPPRAGFSLYGTNHDTTSVAKFHLNARMWATC